MNTIKVDSLPEKLAAEINDSDVLIIEDKYKTCKIKVSELVSYVAKKLDITLPPPTPPTTP